MSSFGVVQLSEVRAMLAGCADGSTFKTREHNHVVRYNGRTFPNLPLGKHGARKDPEIKLGHVRHMIRQLEISLDCAKRFIPQLSS
jgi:hypothetical protein